MTNTKRIIKTLLSRENLTHALSGSTASILALAICYPLDRIRGLAQIEKSSSSSSFELLKKLLKEEGIKGFYTGIKQMLTVLGVSNFVYFYIHAFLKALHLSRTNKKQVSSAVNLVFALIAGIFNVLLTTPLWVVATRSALKQKKKENKKLLKKANPTQKATLKVHFSSSSTDSESPESAQSMFQDMKSIIKSEGVLGLWSGTTTSLLLVSNPAIQFGAYEQLKRILKKTMKNPQLTSIQFFLIGAISKMIATVITYPLQLSQTRLRIINSDQISMFQCLKTIYTEEGFLGWFHGMDAKLTQTCLTASFMFMFYEKLLVITQKLLL